jgi:cytochrome c-type biogenesis protein CcmH
MTTDISQALRELLQARASGQITAEEFEQKQAALHAELLAQPAATRKIGAWRWGLAAAIIAAAGGLYWWLGKPASVSTLPPPVAAALPPMAAQPGNAQPGKGGDLKVMASRLAEKLVKNPANGEGWTLLAQTYAELREPKQADEAFAKAAALQSLDTRLFAEWADVHVIANGRKWDSQARDLVAKALAADPKQLKALALAGSEAFDRADYKKAIEYWKKMREVAPADSMDAKLADANIEEAKAVMSGKPPASAGGMNSSAPAATGATIGGTVALDPALKGKVAPTDTVFVVAKTTDGAGAPLAVKRFTVADLPAKFTLSDGDAMVPARSLSRFGEARISARVSRSGGAIPQPGDIGSNAVNVKLGTADVKLDLGK